MLQTESEDGPKLPQPRTKPDTGNTLACNRLREHCPLDVGRHTTALDPIYTLGKLEVFPPELLTATLSQLDLQTLTDFRRVNQRARQFVDAIPHYRLVIELAPDALRGMLSIETAQYTTLEHLYQTLCTRSCETCGRFGDYLYLLTCRRACFRCFTTNETYLPLRCSDVIQTFGLRSHDIHEKIPRMLSRAGHYSCGGQRLRTPRELFDHDAARRLSLATLDGSVEKMVASAYSMMQKRLAIYRDSMRAYSMQQAPVGPRPHKPREHAGYDGRNLNPHRFVAIVPVVYFDARTRCAEPGFSCFACRWEDYPEEDDGQSELDWRVTFGAEEFEAHVKKYGKVVGRGWHVRSSSAPARGRVYNSRAWHEPSPRPLSGPVVLPTSIPGVFRRDFLHKGPRIPYLH